MPTPPVAIEIVPVVVMMPPLRPVPAVTLVTVPPPPPPPIGSQVTVPFSATVRIALPALHVPETRRWIWVESTSRLLIEPSMMLAPLTELAPVRNAMSASTEWEE